MPKKKIAPKLEFDIQKMDGDSQFYQIPQDICDVVFKELGTKPLQMKVMIVLLGTKPGFQISEKWMLDRLGLDENGGGNYFRARKDLEKRGWLSLIKEESIKVNIKKILMDGNKPEVEKIQVNNVVNVILENVSAAGDININVGQLNNDAFEAAKTKEEFDEIW